MTHWVDAGAVDRIPDGGMRETEAGGVALLLFRLNSQIFATNAICPHHAAWLSEGQISGDAIDCPRHMGRFNIATGRKLRGPACPDLRTYPVRITDGHVEVLLSLPSE